MERAGVIGLGGIGAAIAAGLARAGRLGAIYDAAPHASGTLPPQLPTPADVAASCDVVLAALPDADQTLQALSGPQGLLSRPHPGLVIVLLTRSSMAALSELRKLCAGAGVSLIDCPTSRDAPDGLFCLVGAASTDYQRVKPMLETFAHQVLHMGPPGSGMAARIALDVVAGNARRGAQDAASLADALGLDGAMLQRAFELDSQSTGHQAASPIPPAEGTEAQAASQQSRLDRGLATFERVYGPGTSATLLGADRSEFATETITHLFGEIWSRTKLAIRDRRLMLIGVSAMLARADLVEVQIRGAIANSELTLDEIDEISLFLAFYIGWCNSGPLYRGIQNAKRATAAPG